MDELTEAMRRQFEAAANLPPAERRAEVLQILVTTTKEAFDLYADELAILLLSPDRVLLQFVYPPELAVGNTFPVAVPSLAGHVMETGESLCDNTVREVPHLAFYERVPILASEPVEIQKLLAVVLRGADGRPCGVIEVSRRGASPEKAGPDFGPEEQARLERFGVEAGPTLEAAFLTEGA
jgi:hypothetical protein